MKKRKKASASKRHLPKVIPSKARTQKNKKTSHTTITPTIIGRLPATWTAKKVAALATLAAQRGGYNGKGIVSFKLVADPEMRRLNRMYRDKDKTTDVLSFSYKKIPVIASEAKQSQPTELGDIVISIPQVTRQAKAIDRSVGDEFALMVVHGILHILGHDHETLAQEKNMFSLQHNILAEAKIW